MLLAIASAFIGVVGAFIISPGATTRFLAVAFCFVTTAVCAGLYGLISLAAMGAKSTPDATVMHWLGFVAVGALALAFVIAKAGKPS